MDDGENRRECLILVNITMVCISLQKFISRGLSANLLNITALLMRLAQIITTMLGIKKSVIFCFQERRLLLFYLHALRYVIPLLLYCTKLGYFFVQLTKGALIFNLEVSFDLLGQGFQTLVDYLTQK